MATRGRVNGDVVLTLVSLLSFVGVLLHVVYR